MPFWSRLKLSGKLKSDKSTMNNAESTHLGHLQAFTPNVWRCAERDLWTQLHKQIFRLFRDGIDRKWHPQLGRRHCAANIDGAKFYSVLSLNSWSSSLGSYEDFSKKSMAENIRENKETSLKNYHCDYLQSDPS